LRRLAILLGLGILFLVPQIAHADQCLVRPVYTGSGLNDFHLVPNRPCSSLVPKPPVPDGKVIGTGIIYLYANDEARYSSLNNVLHAVNQLEGTLIYPGEVFSFNRSAKLLEKTIPYDLGPDVSNNLVKAGGVCMVSTLVATAAHDAGLPFINERGRLIKKPVPHSRFYRYYHQVNFINGHDVPIVEAAVAIQKDAADEPWKTVKDLQFVNTSGHILVLHFEPSFTVYDLNLAEPFGLIQRDHSLKVELRALPLGFDALFTQFDTAAVQ